MPAVKITPTQRRVLEAMSIIEAAGLKKGLTKPQITDATLQLETVLKSYGVELNDA